MDDEIYHGEVIAMDELRQRVEAAGMHLSVPHQVSNSIVEWRDGTLNLTVPNLPDEGDGGYWKEFATFSGPDALANLGRVLDGLEAKSKARRCVKEIILGLNDIAEPSITGPQYGKQMVVNAVKIIRDEFGIEEHK